MAKLAIQVSDLAAGHVSMLLFQQLVDELIKRDLLEKQIVKSWLTIIAQKHEGRAARVEPERRDVESAIAEGARAILARYSIPPKSERH